MTPEETQQLVETLRAAVREEVRAEVDALRAELAALSPGDAPAVTVEQAARTLGCGRTRVFELLNLGKLKAAPKVGRSTMVTRASVEALLGSRAGDVSRATLGSAPPGDRRR